MSSPAETPATSTARSRPRRKIPCRPEPCSCRRARDQPAEQARAPQQPAPQPQRNRPSPLPTLGRALRRRPRLAAAATILVLALTAAADDDAGAQAVRPSRAQSPNNGIARHDPDADPDRPSRASLSTPAANPPRPGATTSRRQGAPQATPPLGHRPRAGDRRRHATIRRVLAGTGAELHAGERRPLANADQSALVNKRQQRRPDPHADKLKRHLHAGVEGNAESARHRSRHMRLPVTRTRPTPTGR